MRWTVFAFVLLTCLSTGVSTLDANGKRHWENQVQLAITKVATPDAPRVGQRVTYTITVTNTSDRTALGANVRDRLPATLQLDSARTSLGSCSRANGAIMCNVGDLASATAVTVTIVATPQRA